MTFWKSFPPGWFVYESDWEGDGDEEDEGGGGDDGGGGGDDGGDGGDGGGGDDGGDGGGGDWGDDGGGGDWGGGGDDEGDGDGGIDFSYDRDSGDRDDSGRDRDERDRDEDRRREEEDRRRREEDERRRRIDEQRRQIEDERRRQEQEAERERQRQQAEDTDGDGIPDVAASDPNALPSNDPGIGQRLQEQFQSYEEQRQAQEQAFDPTNPGWIYQSEQTRAERTPSQATTDQRDYGPIDRETTPQNPREPGRDYDPRTSDILTAGPAYKPPAFYRSSEPEPEREREPLRPPESRVPEIAATAAAQAAAASGATPIQIAQTAEHAARIASDQQTLAQQSAWTRAAFRSTYGTQAEEQWTRQHEAELARNRSLYGASEPRAGQAPLANAPAGTPLAPDRRIGQVAPPTNGQTARYGINGIAPAQPAGPPGSVRAPAPGTVTPAAQGLPGFPPPPAPGTAAPVIGPGNVPTPGGIAAPRLPGQPREPEPGQGAGSYPPPRPIGAPSALPGAAAPPQESEPSKRPSLPPSYVTPRPGERPPEPNQGAGTYPAPPVGLPDDTRGYDEGAREAPRVPDEYFPDDILTVTKRDDPFSTRDMTRAEWDAAHQSRPDIEDLWRVDNMRRSPERSAPAPLPDDARQYDEGAREAPRTYQLPETTPQTPEEARRIQNVLDIYGPTQGQRMDIRYPAPGTEDSRIYRPGMDASLDTTDPGIYRPGMTAPPARTQPGYPNFELFASTDTAIPRPSTVPTDYGPGVASPAPHMDPVLASISTTRPLDTLATLAATNKGPDYDPRADATHIANGIAAMLRGDRDENGNYITWAEPYLNDTARIAWAREERQNGRSSDPRNAPIEYIENWKDAFYGNGTDPDTRVPLVKEVQQEMIDHAAARTPPGKPFQWQDVYGPTGEGLGPNAPRLIQPQATTIDCGPAALSALLRSRGYNADPRQTFEFATTHSSTGPNGGQYHTGLYTNGKLLKDGEFSGPANFVNMINQETGMKAEAISISTDPNHAGWTQVDRELAEGRPVVLSSRGHYWTISAKNAEGKYFVGGSALAENPQWMPRGGFKYVTPVNTAILIRGDVDPNARGVKTMKLEPPAGTSRTFNTRPLLSGNTEFEGGPAAGPQQGRVPSGPPTGPPPPKGWTEGNPGTSHDPNEYLRQAAVRKGIDPDQVLAVMSKEGSNWDVVGRFDTGTSYGPLQLHYAGGSNPKSGMGDRFTKDTGIDLRTSRSVADHQRAIDYALDDVLKDGDWHQWYGADKAFPVNQGGKGRFTPIRRITPQTAPQAPAPQRFSEMAPEPGVGASPQMERMSQRTSDPRMASMSLRSGAAPMENFGYTSPRERLGNRLSMEMYRQPAVSGGTTGRSYGGELPGDSDPRAAGRANLPPPAPDQVPSWWPEANPQAGQYAGEGRGRDQSARLWTNSYDLSGGDAVFADVISGIANGEGGFAGVKDNRGATGLFQMDPAGGWEQLDTYLRKNNIPMSRDQAARNIDIMTDFYVAKLYKSYQRAKQAGYTDPEDLTVQTVIYRWDPKEEPGAAHNAGIDGIPSLEKNYREGYRDFKNGKFRLLDRSRW